MEIYTSHLTKVCDKFTLQDNGPSFVFKVQNKSSFGKKHVSAHKQLEKDFRIMQYQMLLSKQNEKQL